MRHTTLVLTLALTSAVLAHPRGTYAQPVGSAKAVSGEDAQRFYQEGNEAYRKGDMKAAETAFLKAWASARTFDVAANLGLVELEQKKYREAAEHLAFSLRTAPPSSKAAQRESTKQSLEEAKKHVVTLRVSVNVSGFRLSVDGQSVAPDVVEPELFVTPGKHVIEATYPDHEPARANVDGAAGSALDVKLELKPKEKVVETPVPTATATSSASATPPAQRSAIPLFVLGAGAVVAAGVGVGLNLVAADGDSASKRTADAIRAAKGSCVPNAGNFDSRCPGLEGQSRNAQTLSGVSVGVLAGAGALAAGAVIYALLPGTMRWRVNAVVVPEGERVSGAINFGGRF